MCTTTVPATAAEALGMLESAAGAQESALRFLAGQDAAGLPGQAAADGLRVLERHDAVEAAVRARLLAVFDVQDGHLADGQRSTRAWLVHSLGVTKGQAAQYRALQGLVGDHPVLLAALAEGGVLTESEALQLARWTKAIPGDYRGKAEEILVAAARAGVNLRGLAAICAEIRARTAEADPDGDPNPGLDRGVSLATTLDGAGVIHGDLTPECTAMVQAVLDALSAPAGGGDLRTRPERYHDALAEAMKRLLASDLLPQRAGQPVKALVHIYFAELREMDHDGILQDKWITEYRTRWAAHRAASSVSAGDGGAWLEGDAARAIAYDAMIVPVVTGDIDPAAVEALISLCVRYDQARHNAPQEGQPEAAASAPMLDLLEQQILAHVIQILSGPGGLASFLRRNLLGKPLAGPSLPLDVGQTDEIPLHLRRLVSLRDQGCGFPGGCDQPASGCEPHHVVHRADGGHTSLTNLKNYCWWHHHVVLHEL